MGETFTPASGPPQGPPPDPEILKELGEEGVRRLLDLHYGNLEQSSIRGMFPENMKASAEKSADFFIQSMGGKPYYSQKYGSPRMRARHLPFTITEGSRQIWVDCFKRAMDELPFPEKYREKFLEYLESFSAWMVNA